MGKRILGALALALAASSAWGYQFSASYDESGPQLIESDGSQTVTVFMEREGDDPPGLCVVDVTVEVGPFVNPPPNEATAGEDYVTETFQFTMGLPGADAVATETLSVTVIDDSLAEPTEQFAAEVTNVVSNDCPGQVFNFGGQGSIPIFDDDEGELSLSVTPTSITVNEDAGTVEIGVTLSGEETIQGGFDVSVDWNLVDGSATFLDDYGDAASGSLLFNEGTLTRTVVVPIVDDSLVEGTEDFSFVLSNASGLLAADESPLQVALVEPAASVQITDNDDPGSFVFVNEPYRVNENEGPAVITLQRQGGTSGELTVFFRAVEGTATDGEDFTGVNGSVTWTDGEGGERTFTVPIIDDADAEGAETVLIRATTDSDFVEFDETTLTIVDDESASTTSFATADVTAATTDESVVLTLVRAGNTDGAVTVDYATADGTAIAGEDYVAAAGTVSWADGDGEDKTIIIQLLPDPTREEPEDFLVQLSNVTGNATLGGNTALSVTITGVSSRNIAEIPSLTPNQRALARWFDQTCGRLAALETPTPEQQQLIEVCSVVRDAATGDATVREALDAINPEELLVSAFNALKLTAVQHGNLTQRLNALRKGARGVNLTGLQLDINGQQIAGNALQTMFDELVGGGASADENVWGRWGAFVNGRLATGDKDKSDNEAGFDFDLYGVTTGVDYRIRDNLIAGVSAGFGSVDTGFANDSGGMDIDSWNAGAYLTYFREQNFYLDALVTYGRNDYDSQRNIVIDNDLGSFSGTARGSTDGTQFSAGFGTGWDFSSGPWTFGPHGGAYYFDVDVDGFDEVGVAGLDLDISDQSTKSLTVNAGGHVSYAILTDWGVLVPNAQVDWVHEFEDNRETLAFRFVNDPFAGDPNDPSPTITLQSDRPDANYFIWSVGMSAQFIHGLSAFVSYQSFAGYSGVDMGEVSFGGRWEKTF